MFLFEDFEPVIPSRVMDEMREVVAGALLLGPTSVSAAMRDLESFFEDDDCGLEQDGNVFWAPTASQAFATIVSEVTTRRNALGAPAWWDDHLGERLAVWSSSASVDVPDFNLDTGYRSLDPVGNLSAHAADDGVVGLPVDAAIHHSLYSGSVLGFVGSGRRDWFPEGSREVDRGVCIVPLSDWIAWRAPITDTTLHASLEQAATILAVPIRDLGRAGDSRFCPPPVLPGYEFGPVVLPDLGFWEARAAEARTSIILIGGTLSERGLQLVIWLSDDVHLDVAPAPWVAIVARATQTTR